MEKNKKSRYPSKPSANASAPSEQELKEEEELQLALALSLNDTSVSFPDCKQFEEASSTSNHRGITLGAPVNAQTVTLGASEPTQYIFEFVAGVQSTAEVFANRVNSSKLRNRSIGNDSAIQALFTKLTNMHSKLLEYIDEHEVEIAAYEALQGKLNQISDSRVALDVLREEHREKMRQEAADAGRQRKNQLSLKLEMMRQKKSQMMQYQREVALQRIQAQEMMMRQPQSNSSVNTPQPQQDSQLQPQQQSQPQPQTQPQQQQPMDEAPLISFDD